MKPVVSLDQHLKCLFIISLLVSAGCATPPKQQLTTVGPLCNISWDRTNDPRVTGYQLTVIDQSGQQNNTVLFIPANTTTISCKDAGANHEGVWDVILQSCYDKAMCGPSVKATPIRITTK